MGEKGHQTRELVKTKAYLLFAANGFRAVTMKDICEACNLSRGGLYRHYGSTGQIFEEILQSLSVRDEGFILDKIGGGVPAGQILKEELELMQKEMLDDKASLSYAIYEYSMLYDNHFMTALNHRAKKRWTALINYGIRRGEFAGVDAEQLTEVILYVYQGVRMWSRVMPIAQDTVQRLADQIWQDLAVKR